MNELPRFMTFKQALNYFNIKSYHTLYSYIEQGLPVIKIGNGKRIDKQDAEAFIASNTISG